MEGIITKIQTNGKDRITLIKMTNVKQIITTPEHIFALGRKLSLEENRCTYHTLNATK